MLKKSSDNTRLEETIIGAQVKLKGTLKVIGSLIINGETSGEIRSKQNIKIGPSAKIKGPIFARNIYIAGYVESEIVSEDSVELTSSSNVIGTIQAQSLIIHLGAIFNGQCKMEKVEQPEKEEEIKPQITDRGDKSAEPPKPETFIHKEIDTSYEIEK